MDHLKGLSVKSLANGIPAILILSTVGGLTFGAASVVAVILTFTAYIAGDLFVLARSNNLIATVADAGLAFFTLWLLRAIGVAVTWTGILYTVLALTLVEWLFFHPYVRRQVEMDGQELLPPEP